MGNLNDEIRFDLKQLYVKQSAQKPSLEDSKVTSLKPNNQIQVLRLKIMK